MGKRNTALAPAHTWRRERFFRLNELPRDESGNILYREDTVENYWPYLDWLADYLYNAKPVLTFEERTGLWRCYGSEIYWRRRTYERTRKALAELSGWLGHFPTTAEMRAYGKRIARHIFASFKHQIHPRTRRKRQQLQRESYHMAQVYISECEDYQRYFDGGDISGEEFAVESDFLDLGWRLRIWNELRLMPDKAKRVAWLDEYFEDYQQAVHDDL